MALFEKMQIKKNGKLKKSRILKKNESIKWVLK
jgi:hypothetical protein